MKGDFMNKEILNKAIEYYGKENQINKAKEELVELLNEITLEANWIKKERVIDEIADVTIMIEQLKIIFCCNSMVEDRIKFKLDRLEKRIDDDK